MTNPDFFDQYHNWYYDTHVWETTTFLGVKCLKSVSDMWNYQEILFELKPSLIIEVGTANGGSALYFSWLLKTIIPMSKVLSIDISHHAVADSIKKNSHIELLSGKLTDESARSRIMELREQYIGPIFVILDSDHTKANVLAEMEALRKILISGDYLVVEDGNINGHPVLQGWGEGPFEAIEEYIMNHPDDYKSDSTREQKFGFTFALKGFLIRN
jgi:cephalosporin hydroxylase